MPLEPLTADRRRQQTREHLLQAAAEVFAERGFHAATLDEVAAAAGFTKGAVYSNFKNKEDLFLALLEDAYARERDALKEMMAFSDVRPEERIGDFVGLIGGELDRAPSMSSLYLEFFLYALRNPAARARMNELEQQDIRAIADILEAEREQRGMEDQEPAERAARIIVALFRGINMMRMANPEAAGDDLLEAAIAFVTRAQGMQVQRTET
jgi:AcrR family transcriptional regulator